MSVPGQLTLEAVDLGWTAIADAAVLVAHVRTRMALERELAELEMRVRALRLAEQGLREAVANAMDEAGVRALASSGARIVRVSARTREEAPGTVVVTARDGVRVFLEERG